MAPVLRQRMGQCNGKRQPHRWAHGAEGWAVGEPSPVRLWLVTGRRRAVLRLAFGVAGVVLLLTLLGPSAVAAPTLALGGDPRLPAPLVSTGLLPAPSSTLAAEELLGAPLLDGAGLHKSTSQLGVWSTVINGPYGRTVLVFQVYSTNRHTWLTVLQVASELPITASPWEVILAEPVKINGRPAQLYRRPGSTTVAWQETPTLRISLSEDSQQPVGGQGSLDQSSSLLLDQDTFMQLAQALHARGTQVGPFRLALPW